MVKGIGSKGIHSEFGRIVRELAIFLSVTCRIHCTVQGNAENVWIYEIDDQRVVTNCHLRWSAYCEPARELQMPTPGARQAIAYKDPERLPPDRLPPDAMAEEQRVPRDIHSLWDSLHSLTVQRRRQFLAAGNAYAIAQSMWPHQRTTYASFLVVACESLKPIRKRFRAANVYDVVASLQGSNVATALKGLALHPQSVRSDMFHRGETADNELAPKFGTEYFEDPSFGHMLTALSDSGRICLNEWLRRSGNYAFVWMPRPKL